MSRADGFMSHEAEPITPARRLIGGDARRRRREARGRKGEGVPVLNEGPAKPLLLARHGPAGPVVPGVRGRSKRAWHATEAVTDPLPLDRRLLVSVIELLGWRA